jgi:hypothetical protein
MDPSSRRPRARSKPDELSDDFLASLVDEFAPGPGGNVHAMALTGSFARGEADAFSDVDLRCLVNQLPERQRDRHWIGYRGGRLVSVTYETAEAKLAEFRRPGSAIWAVPTCRTMRLLLDRDGQLATVRQAATDFTWEPLQPLADELASGLLADTTEVVHKELGALASRDADREVVAAWELVMALTEAVAVQRGVLISSDRHYFPLVRGTVGPTTEWTREHRLAAGEATGSGSLPRAVRGMAAIRLYRETATLLRPILRHDHREVVDGALQVISRQKGLVT